MSWSISWVDRFGKSHRREEDDRGYVHAFADGLYGAGATDVSIRHPGALGGGRLTFGDLGVGDWFVLDGVVWVKTFAIEGHNATASDGDLVGFPMDAIVEPFEWEWAE